MSNDPFFNSGDVVKLKRDSQHSNLKTNDYGIVWAVYSSYADENEVSLIFDYEGTFWNEKGVCYGEMFEGDDAEKVVDLEKLPFSEEMKELWIYLNRKEK